MYFKITFIWNIFLLFTKVMKKVFYDYLILILINKKYISEIKSFLV